MGVAGGTAPSRSPTANLRTATLLLAQAAPAALVLFLLFPRVQGPLCDEQVAALAEHRVGGLGHLLQAGQRTAAQRGERSGEPNGLDHVRR